MKDDRLEQFLKKVKKTPSCWIWMGSKSPMGYGYFCYKGIGKRAHRVSFELFNGKIPEGLVLDHLCRVHDCVNPKHLEAVTTRENTLRGESPAARNARKKMCPKGHPYSRVNKRGLRICRICCNAQNLAWLDKPVLPKKVKNNKPQCNHGHFYSKENTGVYKFKNYIGRFCRECSRIKDRRLYWKKKITLDKPGRRKK